VLCSWDNAAVRLPPRRRLGTSVIVLCLLLAACGGGGNGGEGDGETTGTAARGIIVGSFDFSESGTVGEVYAQALEAAGFPVQRATGLGSREVVEPALEQGALDMVPEYLGTALRFLHEGTLTGTTLTDTATAYPLLRQIFEARGVTALTPAPGQNQNGVAVTRQTAERLGVRRISDLAPVAGGLVFGGPPECPERPFCMLGLRSTYGLAFKEFRALDGSGPLTVAALEGEEVDAAIVFTTSPAAERFVLLEDDRRLQPAENLVPVVRTDTLRRHGDRLRQVLDAVSAQLHTVDLVALNRQVDVDGRPVPEVARAWLIQHGLGPR
jgi:osmoprotectant transport system substrate-binding protein